MDLCKTPMLYPGFASSIFKESRLVPSQSSTAWRPGDGLHREQPPQPMDGHRYGLLSILRRAADGRRASVFTLFSYNLTAYDPDLDMGAGAGTRMQMHATRLLQGCNAATARPRNQGKCRVETFIKQRCCEKGANS
ncbi:hypothetical protein H112_05405 [Trichophyton rubrum D6]|uniref:Uncharacterized protein n=2 Tax=Trichophyton TaxID=5550 RepID=A0A022VZS9_TRIRU|nr:hypothetical protein H100_05424 [Trichophyton rubrum MR850]EZF40662.1 hypothetical protein H102_05387 [Trichophyton rubrum CBS 100081]EZF51288.1 hypothetical protein H103_05417 [Trichophyton rubrum CBS 288.86]EZF61913.1 hypothetical protein H104_05404 [Trichophyton rubrum CBS 289.86]EZF72544.1 hypothetical protein H105_05432 [Trichophyton soudanense CBS 452.61]EZF83233.1 hypothetical protein H110_05411 [Trichophyton rubrum MR1448]EZG05008.1 hypothetical protein H106_05252 [Trichophyton rub